MKPKDKIIIEAPSILGLKPTGTEKLSQTLLKLGLAEAINSKYVISLGSPKYNPVRDKITKLLNGQEIRNYSIRLADTTKLALDASTFPLVLGGDCSILLGCMLGLQRIGVHGLVFMDGHSDFYTPEESPTGEVADMDLALLCGRGPHLLTRIEQNRALVDEQHIVTFGIRDTETTKKDKITDLASTKICSISYAEIIENQTTSIRRLCKQVENMKVEGVWVHIDSDVLDDENMPAVDYRQPGGLTPDTVAAAIKKLQNTKKICGISLTIYNPSLDTPNFTSGQTLVSMLSKALT